MRRSGARCLFCAALAFLLGWTPPLCQRLAAQTFGVRGADFPASSPVDVSASRAAASVSPVISASPNREQRLRSGWSYALAELIDATVEAERREPVRATPGFGSYQPVEKYLDVDLPVDFAVFSDRQRVRFNLLQRLTARQAGLVASRAFGPARLYLGAGMEEVRLESSHPDLATPRHMFDQPITVHEAALSRGRYFAGSDRGYAPRLTLGAGLDLPLGILGADVSVGDNPSVNLSSLLPLF